MMKQLQFYKYTTWGLLLLNIALVVFFFLASPGPPRNREFSREKYAEILHLNEQQKASFIELTKQHHKQMEVYANQQRDLLQPYFNNLLQQIDTSTLEDYLNQIQHLERKKIEYTYRHFQEVKSLLNPAEYIYFEEFVKQASERILDKKKKNPAPPKDFK